MALTFDDTQTAALLEVLGLPADTTDPQLVVDTVADLAAQAGGKPSDVAAAAKAAGLEVVDADTLAGLRTDAAEGRAMKVAAARRQITDTVEAAIAKGKITPARREHWVNLIAADAAMGEVLAAVPEQTAVPLTEIGHGTEGVETDTWFY